MDLRPILDVRIAIWEKYLKGLLQEGELTFIRDHYIRNLMNAGFSGKFRNRLRFITWGSTLPIDGARE
jgi:hypothetical protein